MAREVARFTDGDNPLAAPRGLAVRLWRCSNCAYDLSGLPATGRCPECAEKYEAAWLHVRGWRRRVHVPMRSRTRIMIAGVYLAAFTAFVAHVWMAWPLRLGSMLIVAAVAFAVFVLLEYTYARRRRDTAPRPMHAFLGPTCLDVTGVWRIDRFGWGRFTTVRMRRLERGLWRLTLTGPPVETFGRELWPPDMGLWRITVVFRGTHRDAALIRRVCRQRVAMASGSARIPQVQ
jgi:hypothetical protein